MNCPNCSHKVIELDEKCPNCGTDLSQYEETNAETKIYSTTLITIINVLQLICFIVIGIVNMANENVFIGFVFWLIGIILYAFINGFASIIKLLNEINNKIK